MPFRFSTLALATLSFAAVACDAPRPDGAGAPSQQVDASDSTVSRDSAPDSTTGDPNSYTTTRGATDLIRLTSPLPGDTISSPLTIRGEARGNWFFEASFPLVLTDWDGRIIAQHYATATGEWMTTDFVPFESVLEFAAPRDIGDFSRRGSLILQKNNASGLPEFDDALEITVFFRR